MPCYGKTTFVSKQAFVFMTGRFFGLCLYTLIYLFVETFHFAKMVT